jgi:hypothetical protein
LMLSNLNNAACICKPASSSAWVISSKDSLINPHRSNTY